MASAAPQDASESPLKEFLDRYWRIHFSNAAAMILIAAAFIWANSIQTSGFVCYGDPRNLASGKTRIELSEQVATLLMQDDHRWQRFFTDRVSRLEKCGWPLVVREWQIQLVPKDYPPESKQPLPAIEWFFESVFYNALFGLVVLVAIWQGIEWLYRLGEPRKSRIVR